ncbi:MAG: hypothetical protein PUG15_08515 [Bacteroidales bacterium]|nr:hypothetical protein [Bacteroidales bacterium]
MIFNFNKYSFRGIQDLCQKYHRQIVASPDENNLKYVLDGRRVRFINPLGYFDYAYFGEFTFDGDVMILWTKKMEYARFHKPLDTFSLWSQVPVIFAGVDTGFKDDQHEDIFTGDVVTYRGDTSFVRYLSDSVVPGLAEDNCEVPFERNGDMHKEGTVFSNIKPTLFKLFTIEDLYWPKSQYVPYGISRDEVIERASKAKSKPLFTDDFKPQRGRRIIYQQLSEVLRENDILCYLAKEMIEGEEHLGIIQCADNIPDDYTGEEHSIELATADDFYNSIKTAFHEFLQYAHNNPEKTFVLCDFKEALEINKYKELKTAMQFWEWYEFEIPNVIMPFWIFNNILGWDMIGRD